MDCLPQEVWEHVALYCDVYSCIRLSHASRWMLKVIQSDAVWNSKISVSRRLTGESSFEIASKSLSWSTKLAKRLRSSIAQATEVKADNALDNRESMRRFLLASVVGSDNIWIHWNSHGEPLMHSLHLGLRKVFRLHGDEVRFDRRLNPRNLSFSVPYSNWMVFRRRLDYQLGWFHSPSSTILYVESGDLQNAVDVIYESSSNGRIVETRGYGDILLFGVSTAPVGGHRCVELTAVKLHLTEDEGNNVHAVQAVVIWKQSALHVSSYAAADDSSYLILRNGLSYSGFKLVSMETGRILVGETPASRSHPIYSEICTRASHVECTRFHLVVHFSKSFYVCNIETTTVLASIDSDLSSGYRHVFCSDGNLLASVGLKNDESEVCKRLRLTDMHVATSINYTFSRNGTLQTQRTDDQEGNGIWVVYEDLYSQKWRRKVCFIDFANCNFTSK